MKRHELALWIMATLLFVGGDMITTAIGIGAGASEANHIPAAAMGAAGVMPSMAALKLVVMGLAVIGFTVVPRKHYRETIPATLLIFGLAIVTWNVRVILLL